MTSIIDLIYVYVSNREDDFFEKHPTSEKEHTAYTKIRQALTRKQQEELDEYQGLFARRHFDHEKDVYFQGFKMGAKLILEIIDGDVRFSKTSDR